MITSPRNISPSSSLLRMMSMALCKFDPTEKLLSEEDDAVLSEDTSDLGGALYHNMKELVGRIRVESEDVVLFLQSQLAEVETISQEMFDFFADGLLGVEADEFEGAA